MLSRLRRHFDWLTSHVIEGNRHFDREGVSGGDDPGWQLVLLLLVEP